MTRTNSPDENNHLGFGPERRRELQEIELKALHQLISNLGAHLYDRLSTDDERWEHQVIQVQWAALLDAAWYAMSNPAAIPPACPSWIMLNPINDPVKNEAERFARNVFQHVRLLTRWIMRMSHHAPRVEALVREVESSYALLLQGETE